VIARGASVAGIVALAALTGCGGDSSDGDTIDPTRVEKAIEVSIAEQSKKLSIVVCPTGQEKKEDATFICLATLADGTKYPFKVTQKDDQGNVSYSQAEGGSSSGEAKTG
jgi:hypothetical protein